MITRCYSYNESCPCVHCQKTCCSDMDVTDTDKLCKEAKEHCEKCALENGEPLESEVADSE